MSLISDALQYPVLIAYVSGANNYSLLHFRNGDELLVSKSLSFLAKTLPHFIRIHKTLLLNPACIVSLQPPARSKAPGAVVVEDNTVLPVSRRRWPLLVSIVHKKQQVANQTPSPGPPQSIIFISDDIAKALLFEEVVSVNWPQVIPHTLVNAAILPKLLMSLPEQDQPAFILLDVRVGFKNRLSILQLVKDSPRLGHLPVIMLASLPTDLGNAEAGYLSKANSVVFIPDENSQYISTLEQICHYWLTIAILPPNE